jgi:hypothetical protein
MRFRLRTLLVWASPALFLALAFGPLLAVVSFLIALFMAG